MTKVLALPLLAAVALGVSGCNHDDFVRTEGVTSGAGNAMAANTAMQMVDPWPAGVQDTRLRVPAARATAAAPADDAADAKSSQSSSSSSDN